MLENSSPLCISVFFMVLMQIECEIKTVRAC